MKSKSSSADTAVRTERDSMGEMSVPQSALWGASTQRAALNFPIGQLRFGHRFIRTLALVKLACARTNHELGDLDAAKFEAIAHACKQIATGQFDEHFVVSIFQTGSGTSTNMNANEVIANLAKASTDVHPNDHVNMGQSSNDVIPTTIHVTLACAIKNELLPALRKLSRSLGTRARRFNAVLKTGRTHLQDATPVTFGQEFGGYKAQVDSQIKRLNLLVKALSKVALGGTAVGTGINTRLTFASTALTHLSSELGIKFTCADNHFAAQGAIDTLVEAAGCMQTLACALHKIANDIRWMASGPRAGLSELSLPAIQPGSSIMPGKVNPVILEAVMQVSYRVQGNSHTVVCASQASNFELNVALPVVAHSMLESVELLSDACHVFVDKCLYGVAPTQTGPDLVERGLALCTALAPVIGYEKAALIAKEASRSGETILAVAKRHTSLSEEELKRILDPVSMTTPNLN